MKPVLLMSIQVFATLFLFFVLTTNCNGQSYTTSLGLRWGDGIGATVRQKLMKRTSVEGIFYNHHKSDQTIAGLVLDHHMPVLTKRLNLYAGGGFGWILKPQEENITQSSGSIMANAGIELTLGRLNVSWDIMPVFPIMNNESTGLTSLSAFSLRYVLVKKNKSGLFDFSKNKQKGHKKHKRKKRK
jgi:hypothetical protein